MDEEHTVVVEAREESALDDGVAASNGLAGDIAEIERGVKAPETPRKSTKPLGGIKADREDPESALEADP